MLKVIRCEEESALPDPQGQGQPHPEQLERFMRGELSSPERLLIVRHLLTACPECLPVTRRLWALGDRP